MKISLQNLFWLLFRADDVVNDDIFAAHIFRGIENELEIFRIEIKRHRGSEQRRDFPGMVWRPDAESAQVPDQWADDHYGELQITHNLTLL